MTRYYTKPTVRDWLNERVSYTGDDCLIFPFSRHLSGYGAFGFTENGRKVLMYAHRYMCELVGTGPFSAKRDQPGFEKGPSCYSVSGDGTLADAFTQGGDNLDLLRKGKVVHDGPNPVMGWPEAGTLENQLGSRYISVSGHCFGA